MAQTATQRTTGSTRFKGPTIVTLRGAGSKGHDPLTKGDGLDVGLSVQVPTAQSANSFQIEKPDGTVIWAIDGSGNTVTAGVTNVSSRKVQVALTAAQINGMFVTPVNIIPAPLAGQVIVVDQIMVELDLTATAFAAGGVVHFYYHALTVEIMAQTLAAATIQGGAARTLYYLSPVQTAGGSVLTTDVGVDITNATQAFTTGTGTMKITAWYNVVTEG